MLNSNLHTRHSNAQHSELHYTLVSQGGEASIHYILAPLTTVKL